MKRWLPLLVLGLLLAGALAMGWHRHLSWVALAANQAVLADFVARYPALAAGVFMLIHAVAVGSAIPGAAILSVASGLLFGIFAGTALVTIGATIGATALFLAVRAALAEPVARKFAPLVARLRPGLTGTRLRPGLTGDGFSYLLALRFISVTPFALGSVAAAMVAMRLPPFVAATFLGVIPSTLVLTSVGASVGGVLASGREPELAVIFSPNVLLPFIGLAGLALVPVAWRRWKGETA